MKFQLILFLISMFLFSCVSKKTGKEYSRSAQDLKKQLQSLSSDHILFGHQDDLAYGIGWKGIEGESDVKRVAGDYPALFGWEIGNIGDAENLDGVNFDSIVVYIQRVHAMGGVNTMSWHAQFPVTKTSSWELENIDVPSILPGGASHELFTKKLDLVANLLNRLRDEKGQLIPLIFRPWHEMLGGWFWWGSKTCSADDYKTLFRFTIDYLKHEKKLDNLLIAYSTSADFNSADEFLKCYPGDEYVDIVGFDDYGGFTQNRLDQVVQKMSILVDLAREKDKIPAFTETGSDKLAIPNWYTTNLLQVLKATEKTRSLAYVMVWRNRDTEHFYTPHENHEQANDFKEFVNDKIILLLQDYNKTKK